MQSSASGAYQLWKVLNGIFWTDSSLGLAWPCHFCCQFFFGFPFILGCSCLFASRQPFGCCSWEWWGRASTDATSVTGLQLRGLFGSFNVCNFLLSYKSVRSIVPEKKKGPAWLVCKLKMAANCLVFLRFHVPGSELGQWPQTHVDEANFKNSSLEALVLLQASWVEEQFPVLLGLIKKFSKKDFRAGISCLGAEDDLSCLLDSFFLWGRLKWKCAVDMLYFWHCALFLIVSNLLFLATSATCALVSGSSYKHIASSSPTPASPDPAYCIASLGP